MDKEFGLKELYDLTLKATYPIEIEGRTFEVGEVVARFDKIQIANFREITERVTANGGYRNGARVVWDDPKEIQLSFTQGIFSKQQFALLSNSNILKSDNAIIYVPFHERGESDGDGNIILRKGRAEDLFVYNADTYEKIGYRERDMERGMINIGIPYQDVLLDYNYAYSGNSSTMIVGQNLIKGFLSLEGKTRVKDDLTGKTHTAILRIPRLKLVSDLVMRLGREASPMVANFQAIGYPEGDRRNEKIMEMIFLDDDIDADI